MRRGQMELLGMALVVVILSLVLLFVVRFIILRPIDSGTDTYQESEMAANFLTAMLRTESASCRDITLRTLIQDCANHPPDGRITCGSPVSATSCDHVRTEIGTLLDQTLGSWNLPYRLIGSYQPLDEATAIEALTFGEPCTGNRRLRTQPLPLDPPDQLHLTLTICGETFI